MKNLNYYFFLFFLILLTFPCHSQENVPTTSDRPVFGVQAGFLGIWVHNEAALSTRFHLRSEAGLNLGFGGGGSYNQFKNTIGITEGAALVASISLEPRFYYNLKKRLENEKNVFANSANFIALNMNYFPGWLVAAQNRENVGYTKQISFIPYWGIKRTIQKHFTYEAGAGLGYLHNFSVKGRIFDEFDNNALFIHLHLRVGYTF